MELTNEEKVEALIECLFNFDVKKISAETYHGIDLENILAKGDFIAGILREKLDELKILVDHRCDWEINTNGKPECTICGLVDLS